MLEQPFGPVLCNYAFYLAYPDANHAEVHDACAWISAQASTSASQFQS